MAGDPVRIAQFWQAVEIFSPQSLPTIDPKDHKVDLQRRDRVPWDQHSHLPEAEPGYAWRHEFYGGLYELRRVRDAEGRRAGMNKAPDRLYHAVAVVLCVRVVCTLAENDVAGVSSGIRGSRVENRPGPGGGRPYTSPGPGQAKPAQ